MVDMFVLAIDMLLPAMDTSLPGPLLVDMHLLAMVKDTSLQGHLMVDMFVLAIDMLLPAMDTILPGPHGGYALTSYGKGYQPGQVFLWWICSSKQWLRLPA